MIENYGVFNYHEINNKLLIRFTDEKVTSELQKEGVNVLYHNERIIGYSIKDFIRYAKIKYSGIIFLPHHSLIDVINSILLNASLEPLAYKNSSGYIIKKIDDKKVVYCLPGVFLRDESISNGHICTYHDLYIANENENDILLIEDEISVNLDFFKMEVK